MQYMRRAAAITAFVFAASTPGFAVGPAELTGIWVTDDGLGAVEFAACGGSMRCGHIVWIKDPLDKDGHPIRDTKNPDPVAREKPLCGAEIVKNLKHQDDGSWDEGTVYDPGEGKSYSVAIKVLPDGNLEVTGYMGTKLLSETMIWPHSPANLTKCSKIKG